jgi:hypothetical protein
MGVVDGGSGLKPIFELRSNPLRYGSLLSLVLGWDDEFFLENDNSQTT